MTVDLIHKDNVELTDTPEGRRYLSSPDPTETLARNTGGDDSGLNPVAVAILAMALWALIGLAWYALT
jgi:hypothetical protein